MKEATGDIWNYPAKVLCITTNGDVNSQGKAVMGRGVALQAAQRFHTIPYTLADTLHTWKLTVSFLEEHDGQWLLAFPVKYHWKEKADLKLIKRSAEELKNFAEALPDWIFVLARPGCGNGGLDWGDVAPILIPILPDNVHVIDLP